VVLELLHTDKLTQTEMAKLTDEFLQPYEVNMPKMSINSIWYKAAAENINSSAA
jgi:hypothetical protein